MNLSKSISKIVFTIAFISTFLAFFVTIIFQYNSFEKDKKYMHQEFIKFKKNEIKREVLRVIEYIEYKQSVLKKEKLFNNIDVQIKTKDDILNWISKIRFGKNGYIFVNTIDKKALVFDGKKKEGPKLHPNLEIFNKQVDAIKNKNGDFFFYNFKKLNTDKAYPKLAFVKEYPEYGWIIGSGVYIDEINKELLRKEKIFKDTIQNQINFLILVLFFISIGIYFISKRVSRYIDENITNLISAFEKASLENKAIDTNNLTYHEFISLANKLNTTLENKNKTEEKLQDYINIVNEHVIISSTDKHGIINSISKAFSKISGYTQEELIGKSHNIVKHKDMSDKTYKQMWKTLKKGESWRGELKNINKNGDTYWVDAIIQPTYENKILIGYTAIRNDITNKKRVEYLSITDELTLVYNRRHFNKIIEEELIKKQKENSYLSIMMIDVDYFKLYNDNYGHQEGDDVLFKISSIFKDFSKRSSDFIFRLGGEEFAIIFSSNDENKSFYFANSIREAIEDLKIEHKKSEISKYITVSIGLVNKKANEIANSAELYKLADEALYKAKKSGRNCIYMQ